jgi:hypothetical protein
MGSFYSNWDKKKTLKKPKKKPNFEKAVSALQKNTQFLTQLF